MHFALNKRTYTFLSVFGAFCIAVLDQYIKNEVRQKGGFYACNKGISFGLEPPFMIFWLILAVFLFFGLFWLFYKKSLRKGLLLFSLGLIAGGAASNILDRFIFGCVFDYIFISQRFPLINLSDLCISLGAGLFVYFFLFKTNSFGA